MRTITVGFVVSLFLISLTGVTQTITVTQCQALIANSTNNALTVNIPEADQKNAVEAWRKLMRGYGSKITGQTEYLAEKVRIREISPDLIDVYAVFKQKEGFVEMIVAFKTGTGFLNSATTPVAYGHAEKIVKDFALKHSRDVIQKRLSKEKTIFKKLSKEERKIRKNINTLNRNIDKYTRRIEKARKNIEANDQSYSKISKEIEDSKGKIERDEKKLREIR